MSRKYFHNKDLERIVIDQFSDIVIEDHNMTCPYDCASNFLMGSCQLFALELNHKYGYQIFEIRQNIAVHYFCKTIKNEKDCYIDVRGITNDFSEFLFGTNLSRKDDYTIREAKVVLDDEWDKLGLKFARKIIESYPEYYDTRFY